jgi:hypothetical protein
MSKTLQHLYGEQLNSVQKTWMDGWTLICQGQLGMNITRVHPTCVESDTPFLDSVLLKTHVTMVKVLKAVFEVDMRMVRPLKLFAPDTPFGGPLLASVESSFALSDTSLDADRTSFLNKVHFPVEKV